MLVRAHLLESLVTRYRRKARSLLHVKHGGRLCGKFGRGEALEARQQHRFVRGVLQGKLNTEALLTDRGLNWTSVRPVYIYGPLNYNPVEEWFFHRLKAGRPIPVPNSGQQVRIGYHIFRFRWRIPPTSLSCSSQLALAPMTCASAAHCSLHTWRPMLYCMFRAFACES